jgi:indole-3-glycerol phosphate synthase
LLEIVVRKNQTAFDMDFLTKIIERKRTRLQAARAETSIAEMRRKAVDSRLQRKPHALLSALVDGTSVNVIAEIKRASPSRGEIKAGADPVTLAHAYSRGGAIAVSVLTEEDYFHGSLDDLRAVRSAVSLPLLRKDFIFDEFQLYEAAATGADAVLLIVAALADEALRDLRSIAEDELAMDALIEVHTSSEMGRAVACGATLVGVNNRDLKTFEVSLETSARLIGEVPRDVVCISESGLHAATDLCRLRAAGYKGFLIGEMLMRADDPEKALRELLEEAAALS